MTDLSDLETFVQLHQTIEVYYTVDGYAARYMIQDGNVTERVEKGATIMEALHGLEISLREKPPKTGGPKR